MKKLYLFTTLILFSCSPYLGESTVRREFYRLDRRCAQGPFVLKTILTGNRWGENTTLIIYTKRDIKLNYEIKSESLTRKGTVGYTQLNGFCLSKSGNNKPGLLNGSEISSVENTPKENPPAKLISDNPPVDLLVKIPSNPLVSTSPPTWYDTDLKKVRKYRKYQINIFSNRIEDLETKTLFKKGNEVRIILWSVIPNDLDGVIFEWAHVKYTPNDEKKWINELKRKKKDHERKLLKEKKRQQEYERSIELARLKRCLLITENGKQWKICRQFENQDQLVVCMKNSDKSCWDRKLRSVTIKEYKPPRVVHKNVSDFKTKPPAREPAVEKKSKQKESVFILDPPLIVKKEEPTGPPPPPEIEIKPPKPSTSSVWVNGFQKWYKGKWYWMGGFWRVPEEDIKNNKTVKAPRMPPPPVGKKIEFVPPVPGAVWSSPYYMWDGGRWIFISGRWIYPPGKNLKYIPPHWQKTPLGIFFIPGMWVKQ